MDNLLLTKILGVSLIFAVVAIIGLVNVLRLNFQLGRLEKQKNKKIKVPVNDDKSNIYEFKRRK